jgi:hypothetical protein
LPVLHDLRLERAVPAHCSRARRTDSSTAACSAGGSNFFVTFTSVAVMAAPHGHATSTVATKLGAGAPSDAQNKDSLRLDLSRPWRHSVGERAGARHRERRVAALVHPVRDRDPAVPGRSYPVNGADRPVVPGPDHPQVRVVRAVADPVEGHHDPGWIRSDREPGHRPAHAVQHPGE